MHSASFPHCFGLDVGFTAKGGLTCLGSCQRSRHTLMTSPLGESNVTHGTMTLTCETRESRILASLRCRKIYPPGSHSQPRVGCGPPCEWLSTGGKSVSLNQRRSSTLRGPFELVVKIDSLNRAKFEFAERFWAVSASANSRGPLTKATSSSLSAPRATRDSAFPKGAAHGFASGSPMLAGPFCTLEDHGHVKNAWK